MKCTDSKRKRRRRALIRLMGSTFFLLCILLAIIVEFKFFKTENKAAEFETERYNCAYHKENLFASDLCVVRQTENKESPDVSKLKAFGLFNINQSNPVYAFQVFDKIYPASTTKILTALVALENADVAEMVTVSKNASSTSFAWDEQTCGIKEGDKLTLESLLHGLLLYSGNDTAVAIAEHVGGSVEGFAEMMNARAKELMATHSNFVNPSGLYNDDHYTTAYDLYLIFNECIKHEEFVNIIDADSYTAKITRADETQEKIKWEPTNFYALGVAKSPENVTVVGGKTGTLKVAGNCLILMAEDKDRNPYISIVMGAETRDILYKDMTTLLAEIPKNK